MYIRIAANGEVPLLDVDNMRRYSVVAEIAADSVKQLAEITTRTQDNHCRADAEAVAELCAREPDLQWVSSSRDVRGGMAAYANYDEVTKRVKAYLEHRDD